MFDHRATLMRFAKAKGLYAPVVLDGSRAVLLMSAPVLLSEAAFIDDVARKADQLLGELTERGADGVVGLSDIGREAGQLPALYQQSLFALDRQNRAGLSRVVFYDQRDSQTSEHQVVSRIQAILEAEYKSPLSLDAIAERLFLSPSHMRRLFKNKTGATVMDYLENLRLEKSLNLLAQPHLKIHEIGMLVGYENPSYFNAVFKRRYGVTPGEYRKAGTRLCEK
jgi:AraC-like DNA-binding protein